MERLNFGGVGWAPLAFFFPVIGFPLLFEAQRKGDLKDAEKWYKAREANAARIKREIEYSDWQQAWERRKRELKQRCGS